MYKKILFVCTGNTCRSAMAEALLKKLLKDNYMEGVEVWSKGLAGSSALKIPPIVIELMNEEGIDITKHVSQPLLDRDILSADLILVMEEYHKERILQFFPETKSKVFLLKEFAGEEQDLEILDPIGQENEVYRVCEQELKKCLIKIIDKIKQGGSKGWVY